MICKVCGKDSEPFLNYFCSMSCYQKFRYRRTHPFRRKTCLGCGVEFTTSHNKQKFCSQDCANNNIALKVKRPPIKKPCTVCGVEIVGISSKKYCEECKRKSGLERNKKRKIVTCIRCGKEFLQSHGSEKYCSIECVSPIKQGITLNCLICNKSFIASQANQKFCSIRCRNVNKNRKKNRNRKVGSKCEICGFSLFQALEFHHYNQNEGITLCGNCHNIWHRVSENKYSSKEELINLVANVISNAEKKCNKIKDKMGVVHRTNITCSREFNGKCSSVCIATGIPREIPIEKMFPNAGCINGMRWAQWKMNYKKGDSIE